MIPIDNITIITVSVLLVIAVVTPFVNVFFRKPNGVKTASVDEQSQQDGDEIVAEEGNGSAAIGERDGQLPAVSIVLTPHENARDLEETLPLYLSLDYEPGYEVIVVAWKGDTETEDVLKRYAGSPHLYVTFVPDSSRYMSRKKLAITLGVKAAKNEWIMLTEAECRPQSTKWLRTMARNCDDSTDMVVGYSRYVDETSAYRRFEHLLSELYLMREMIKGRPYRTGSKNFLFRKSMFMAQDGYRGNLKYLRGEYDFMVNKYAGADNLKLEIDPDGWMIEQEPTDKEWRNKHLFYVENRKHMMRSTAHRLLYNIDQTVIHLNYICIIAALAVSVCMERWVVTGAAALALLITMILRIVIANKKLKAFSEPISPIMIIPYELILVWKRLGYMLKYIRADKNDFISHKI